MTDSALRKFRSDLLVPVFEDLTEMILLIRNAFNRQKKCYLDEATQVKTKIDHHLDHAKKQLKDYSGQDIGPDAVTHVRGVLSHLEVVADSLKSLIAPLTQQIANGVLFSDKGISQTNFLFDHEAGLFRSMADILLTDNQILEHYVDDKINEMERLCIEFATDHEARLIEGLCQPQCAPIFLVVLDSIRVISHHEKEMVRLVR